MTPSSSSDWYSFKVVARSLSYVSPASGPELLGLDIEADPSSADVACEFEMVIGVCIASRHAARISGVVVRNAEWSSSSAALRQRGVLGDPSRVAVGIAAESGCD